VSTFDTDDRNEMIDQITQYVTIQLASITTGQGMLLIAHKTT
jgi:hypothetical protein